MRSARQYTRTWRYLIATVVAEVALFLSQGGHL